jgi:hypothetical protein
MEYFCIFVLVLVLRRKPVLVLVIDRNTVEYEYEYENARNEALCDDWGIELLGGELQFTEWGCVGCSGGAMGV